MLVIDILFCPDLEQLSNVEKIIKFRIGLRHFFNLVNGYLVYVFSRLYFWNNVEFAHFLRLLHSRVGFCESLRGI